MEVCRRAAYHTSPDDRGETRTHAHVHARARQGVQGPEKERDTLREVACHGSMDLASGQSRGLLHFLASRNFLLVPLVRSRESGGVLVIGYTAAIPQLPLRSSCLRGVTRDVTEIAVTSSVQRRESAFAPRHLTPSVTARDRQFEIALSSRTFARDDNTAGVGLDSAW